MKSYSKIRILSLTVLSSILLTSCWWGDSGDDCCDEGGIYGISGLIPEKLGFAGSRFKIAYTEDQGQSYHIPLIDTTGLSRGRFNDLKLNPNYGLAVGSQGTVYRSAPAANYGLDWSKLDVGYSGSLRRISFGGLDYNYAYVAGDSGTVLKTSNSGNSWSQFQVGTAATLPRLYGISCPDSSTCYTAGEGGAIYKTTNGGSSWQWQNSATSNDLHDIFAFDSNTAWAVGKRGTLTYTTDGGSNWELHDTDTKEDFRRVTFKDRLNGIVLGGNYLARTDDGGETFIRVGLYLRDPCGGWKSLFNTGNFLAIGGGGRQYAISPDFGTNWAIGEIPNILSTPVPTGTPEPTATTGTAASPTPTAVATATSPGIQATPTATATVPAGPTGCAAVHGTFHSDGGCGISGTEVSVSGGVMTLNPFGTNGSQKFNISGTSGNSQKQDLFILGASPHECRVNCASNGSSFDVHCQRTGNPGISCNEEFS